MLTLYIKTGCPFCHKVLDFASRNDINMTIKDIYSDPATMEELIARGGKRQVPYLVDDELGTEMYESGDIVDYLKAHYVHQDQSDA